MLWNKFFIDHSECPYTLFKLCRWCFDLHLNYDYSQLTKYVFFKQKKHDSQTITGKRENREFSIFTHIKCCLSQFKKKSLTGEDQYNYLTFLPYKS